MAVSNYLKSKTEMENIEKLSILESRTYRPSPGRRTRRNSPDFCPERFYRFCSRRNSYRDYEKPQTMDRYNAHGGIRYAVAKSFSDPGRFIHIPCFRNCRYDSLLPFLIHLPMNTDSIFLISACATVLTFFITGLIKGKVLNRSILKSGLETLLVGCFAALLAYFVGKWLKNFSIQIP